ncbi:MAG: hypothetical protein IIA45_06415 [Bacteroidetes bacterium]|nr:hypothetical protein [Bacteroidota bacterium]
MRTLLPFYLSFLLIVISVLSHSNVWAQCCSPGNPVGGSTNQGLLNKGVVRVLTFSKHSNSKIYMQGNKEAGNGPLKSANYNYLGMITSYGLTNKIGIETEFGYFINKTQVSVVDNFNVKGYGFSNILISLKGSIVNNEEKNLEITGGLGINIPSSTKPQQSDGNELPIDVQSSTGSYGIVAQTFIYKNLKERKLKLFLINRFEQNFTNPQDYRPGGKFYTSVFVSKSLNPRWAAILQIRNEIRGKDIREDAVFNSSGGVFLFVAPQLNLTIAPRWNISILADIPAYRYYGGTQLANQIAGSLVMTKDF